MCERCGYLGARDVHHKTYRYLGSELDHLDSVIHLCRECHEYMHREKLGDRPDPRDRWAYWEWVLRGC